MSCAEKFAAMGSIRWLRQASTAVRVGIDSFPEARDAGQRLGKARE
jgi:hypothetical protein